MIHLFARHALGSRCGLAFAFAFALAFAFAYAYAYAFALAFAAPCDFAIRHAVFVPNPFEEPIAIKHGEI